MHGFTRGLTVEAVNVLYHYMGEMGVGLKVNGSITPVEIDYVVPAKTKVSLQRMAGYLSDQGGYSFETYGAMSKLTNGLLFEIIQNGVPHPTVKADPGEDPFTVKSNSHWSLLAGTDALNITLTGMTGFPIRWSFFRGNSNRGIVLREGDIFRITVQDDLTGLLGHELALHGISAPAEAL